MRNQALQSSFCCYLRDNFCSSVAFFPGSSNPIVTTSNTSWKPKTASILTFQSSNNFPSKTGKDPWMILLEPAMLHLDPSSPSYTLLLSQRFLYTRSWTPRTPLSHHSHEYDGEKQWRITHGSQFSQKESQKEKISLGFWCQQKTCSIFFSLIFACQVRISSEYHVNNYSQLEGMNRIVYWSKDYYVLQKRPCLYGRWKVTIVGYEKQTQPIF